MSTTMLLIVAGATGIASYYIGILLASERQTRMSVIQDRVRSVQAAAKPADDEPIETI